MKTICLIPKRYVVSAPLMLLGALLTCYNAGANARPGNAQSDARMAGVAPAERDRDPEYLEKRFEFAKRFAATFGHGVYVLDGVEPRVRPRPTPQPRP